MKRQNNSAPPAEALTLSTWFTVYEKLRKNQRGSHCTETVKGKGFLFVAYFIISKVCLIDSKTHSATGNMYRRITSKYLQENATITERKKYQEKKSHPPKDIDKSQNTNTHKDCRISILKVLS